MARKRDRRTHTQHRGVKLKQIKRTGTWVARFVDPRTGRETQVSLNRLGKSNPKERKDWCIDKAQEIAAYRAAKLTGKTVETKTPIKQAFDTTFDIGQKKWRTNTIAVYDRARNLFEEWCKGEGIKHIEAVKPIHLTQFHDALLSQEKLQPKRGKGERFKRESKGKARSPRTINTILNSTRSLLNMMRRRDLLPELSSDAIFDRLAYLPEDRSLPEFLNTGQIKALLEAADRHDAKLTDGQGHYHYAIAPFIRVVLLTGLRLAEALSLRWRDVDFDEWVIRLPESAGKGGRGRLITLKESPSVHALLSARKAAAAAHDPFVFSRTIIKNNRLRHDALSRETAESCRKRIGTKFKFPFSWHTLRRTCATFLVCAPGIYGAASAFLAARRLGHSVTVSERLYAGQLTNIPPECRTLEQAMQIAAKPKPIDTTTTDIFVND